jgi:hypothetical protein
MQSTLVTSNLLYRYIDRGALESLAGSTGISRTVRYTGALVELFATGFIPHIAFTLIAFVIIVYLSPLALLPYILTFIILSMTL